MVARAGDYYGAAFKIDCGVTQVDLLSPTIFNMVVSVVVSHWVTVMLEGLEEQVERGQEGKYHNAIFYAGDGMVAFSDPRCIQCHRPHRRGHSDAYPLVQSIPALPRPPPSPSPSTSTPHPPLH